MYSYSVRSSDENDLQIRKFSDLKADNFRLLA